MEVIQKGGLEKDTGPQKVYQFLSRTGFLDTVADEEKLRQWMEWLSFQDFEDHLVRINGLVRQVRIKDRRVDGESVSIQTQFDDVSYIPPQASDKRGLLEKSFEQAKTLPEKDAGLLLYFALQAIHPFVDGNGRTGRLLYLLLEKGSAKQAVGKDELENFLIHDGDSGPGRESFTQKVRSPEQVYSEVEKLLASDVLGPEITDKFKRVFSGLQSGTIESFTNKKLSEETKTTLTRLMSEGGGGNFAFRNIVLLKYLKDNGLFEADTIEDESRQLLRFDGNKILENLSEEEANEIMAMHANLKKQFVEKLIDIISDAQKYQMSSGGSLKDHLYT